MSTTPPARPAPRRKDAIEKTRAIERAATDLVLERGYEAVTVDMICELAGVSQRTFFNHFKTKDAALLGVDPPTVDERAAREFIVSTGPLLAGAAQLIRVDPGGLDADPEQLARRIRAIGSNPMLITRQLERIEAVESEVREILVLRLKNQYPDEDPAERERQAGLIVSLVAGLMRYIGRSWAAEAADGRIPDIDPAAIERLLHRVLPKLG
ncbi:MULTISPECIES: TetR/AcrR family transcriptional regulator [unclassified Microbacterium]|uniref:TetR/AcrR family transcriptional regulator n=1 Tax=unclassified Microbacterium TaxID=2609290 RepID=UPI000F54DD6F|nr:TetR/AcrR family transcriptional regulator [Microbacterium sp. ABRD28]AZC15035.1 TetR/AcrR family transcriptional regulator [Microbacterium sp. ABRD28]